MSPAAQLCTLALRLRLEGLPVGQAWEAAVARRSWAPATRRLALVTYTAAVRRMENDEHERQATR